jgi:hypothetical protein
VGYSNKNKRKLNEVVAWLVGISFIVLIIYTTINCDEIDGCRYKHNIECIKGE